MGKFDFGRSFNAEESALIFMALEFASRVAESDDEESSAEELDSRDFRADELRQLLSKHWPDDPFAGAKTEQETA